MPKDHIQLSEARAKAASIAKQLKGGEIFALIGPMGAGKTTFTQALTEALGVKEAVSSPTFSLMNRYEGMLWGGAPITIYHADLYRTESFEEVAQLGLTETWGLPTVVTVIEWADKIHEHLPPETHEIHFQP
jgi:tRNA threonylcarbamoyladenosine biosynthesis protein TsaE